jgi:hypothetical protein
MVQAAERRHTGFKIMYMKWRPMPLMNYNTYARLTLLAATQPRTCQLTGKNNRDLLTSDFDPNDRRFSHYQRTKSPAGRMNGSRLLILFDFTFLAATAKGAILFFLLDIGVGDRGLGLGFDARRVASAL